MKSFVILSPFPNLMISWGGAVQKAKPHPNKSPLQHFFPQNSVLYCSVPDRQRPDPHPRHGEPAHCHPVHHGPGALPARGAHLLQPAGHAPLPDQRDGAPPPHAGRGAVRGLQSGLRGPRRCAATPLFKHFKRQNGVQGVLNLIKVELMKWKTDRLSRLG